MKVEYISETADVGVGQTQILLYQMRVKRRKPNVGENEYFWVEKIKKNIGDSNTLLIRTSCYHSCKYGQNQIQNDAKRISAQN